MQGVRKEMSKQVTESTLSKVNRLIGIDESYKAPERIMEIIRQVYYSSQTEIEMVEDSIARKNQLDY